MKYIKIKGCRTDEEDCDYIINTQIIDYIVHYINDDEEDEIKIFLTNDEYPIIAKDYTLESILYLIDNA